VFADAHDKISVHDKILIENPKRENLKITELSCNKSPTKKTV